MAGILFELAIDDNMFSKLLLATPHKAVRRKISTPAEI